MVKKVGGKIKHEGTKVSIMHSPHEDSKEKKQPKKKKLTARERDELLIENFVGLQQAMTNLSIKFGSLSDNLSMLLQVFEESAKNFVSGGKPNDKDMLDKIDSLLDQNKTIAKGLVLMEGTLRGRSGVYEPAPQQSPQPEGERPRPKPLPI